MKKRKKSSKKIFKLILEGLVKVSFYALMNNICQMKNNIYPVE